MLSNIIKIAEGIPFSSSTIERICNGRVNIFFLDELAKMNDPGLLFVKKGFEGPVPCCILYAIESRENGHWVSVTYQKELNLISYYDSYGKDASFYEQYGNYIGYLDNLLHIALQNGINIDLIPTKLQKIERGVNTCGRYAALRCVFDDLTNEQFDMMITEKIKPKSPDEIVTIMTIIN